MTVIERRLTVRNVVVGVLAAEELKAQVGCGAPSSGDDIVAPGLHPRSEVEGVRVIQSHLGERPGTGLQEWVVAVVVESQMRARRNTTGQVLQTLQQIGLGFDVRGLPDQSFGFGDRIYQGLRVHGPPRFNTGRAPDL